MALSHERLSIVDLTNEPDSPYEETTRVLLPGARRQTDAARVPLPPALSKPTTTPVMAAQSSHTPVRGSYIQRDASQSAQNALHTPRSNGVIPSRGTIRSPTIGSAPSVVSSTVPTAGYGAAMSSTHNKEGYFDPSRRPTKRMKVSQADNSPTSWSPLRPPNTVSNASRPIAATPAYSPARMVEASTWSKKRTEPVRASYSEPMPIGSSNKIPSVRDINQALKSNSTRISLLDHVTTNAARTLQIGRIPQTTTTNLGSPVNRDAANSASQVGPKQHSALLSHQGPEPGAPRSTAPNTISKIGSGAQSMLTPAPWQPTMPRGFSTSRQGVVEDNDSVMAKRHLPVASQSLDTVRLPDHETAAKEYPVEINLSDTVPTKADPHTTSKRTKFTNQFTKDEDHFLIFLKEVKAYQWKTVTSEFNAVFPTRAYHTLQSRYSTVLNKRDRSQDPATLSLPTQFGLEAAVDWAPVHASNPGPRGLSESKGLHIVTAPARPEVRRHLPREGSIPQIFPIRQAQDHDHSSGGESGPRRERPSRAARVNYTWPRQRRRDGDIDMDDAVGEDYGKANHENEETLTPAEDDDFLPGAVIASNMEPLRIDFEAADARVALEMTNGTLGALTNLPYLSVAQCAAMRHIALEWAHDSQYRQSLQNPPWHVDFSPNEIDLVKKSIMKVEGTTLGSRHSTRRRQLRELLKGLAEAKLLQIADDLRRTLRSRDTKSIKAFLQDAAAGMIADIPRLQRLVTSRPDDRWSTRRVTSSTSCIRDRELGQQSTRGWRAASKPLTYQFKNKIMDTFGTVSSWTGASSDIHAVAWAPNGEMFAAAAVAVDDPHSMQYNRPNNLLFGECSSNALHELGEHYREREMTEQGPNSIHAMFASQDPKIYNTVSSLGFSISGSVLYSAGYDGSICVWHTNSEDSQPILGAKLNVKAPIDMVAVNPVHEGVLAAAVKVANSKAVKLLEINEENPSLPEKHNLYSSKAVSRPELRILPTAIQFEPRFGDVLLAGFGASIRDSGFDTTGDVCLWNVETTQPLNIYGAGLNVFDVEFNPNRSAMPLFAVGCVAGGNVNRGTRSIVRLYDERADNRYGYARETECKALDINDVVWCPHDEYMIAAGCTDGRAYVWDVRYEMDPLHVLSHGKSVMPLQDGIKHEFTDTGVRFLSWGDNATRLYSGSSDGVVKVWDVTRAKEDSFIKDIIHADSGIMAGAFSPDHSKLIVGEVNGSINVLEVGREGCRPADAPKLRYVPYENDDDKVGEDTDMEAAPGSGIAEGHHLLSTGQLQIVSMGSLPGRQVVQGPAYNGPYDQSVEASMLREKASKFQRDMAATPGPQCILPACRESINKTTSEDIGDSNRSLDRIPDSLSRAWKSSELTCIVPGKSKCTSCGRAARPVWDNAKEDATVLCERCCFACLRCGAATSIVPGATSLSCDCCATTWDIGTLGYEVTPEPPRSTKPMMDAPPLKAFGRAAYLERLEDVETSFGDEMNALSDYYFSLAIDRPESPPL
ncbi:hypothetical protein T440DRAFT_504490 [Plenodomus tracheiphilus IPT5]|uniref:Uncharacterized protein n=1 Tax=Plenodomus tracheiphilus IPT5 TaxID=1408161 RepID=A0A6A7BHR3_9PLEO|nr:hypothetical protein T440DRAFT_504490 [Plenodomus tracheiphilus IPT5]